MRFTHSSQGVDSDIVEGTVDKKFIDNWFIYLIYYLHMNQITLETIEQAIARARPEEQRELLTHLPKILHLSVEDMAWLKAAEPSFEFWNNPDDTIYDQL